jgi:hypothetical protein
MTGGGEEQPQQSKNKTPKSKIRQIFILLPPHHVIRLKKGGMVCDHQCFRSDLGFCGMIPQKLSSPRKIFRSPIWSIKSEVFAFSANIFKPRINANER